MSNLQFGWQDLATEMDQVSALFWRANEKLVQLGKLHNKAIVLELGCGAGDVARSAVGQVTLGRVVGIDAAANLVELAKQRHTGFPNLSFHHHDAHVLKFKSNAADVVYGRHVLPFFDDPQKVLDRSFDVLKPGGRAAFMHLGDPANSTFLTAVQDVAGPHLARLAEWGAPARTAHVLERAGFEGVRTRAIEATVRPESVEAYWSVLRGCLGIRDPNPPASLQSVLGQPLTVELAFAMGRKPDPEEQQERRALNFDDVVANARRSIPEVNPHEVRKSLGKKVVYVDVRDDADRSDGTIEGAIHIPRAELEARVQSEIEDAKTTVVTFDRNGTFGILAASRLVDLGYKNVWNLAGGFESWKEYGMPVE